MLERVFGRSYLILLTCRSYVYLDIELLVKAAALLELDVLIPSKPSKRACGRIRLPRFRDLTQALFK